MGAAKTDAGHRRTGKEIAINLWGNIRLKWQKLNARHVTAPDLRELTNRHGPAAGFFHHATKQCSGKVRVPQ
jgi:hypothetical protein